MRGSPGCGPKEVTAFFYGNDERWGSWAEPAPETNRPCRRVAGFENGDGTGRKPPGDRGHKERSVPDDRARVWDIPYLQAFSFRSRGGPVQLFWLWRFSFRTGFLQVDGPSASGLIPGSPWRLMGTCLPQLPKGLTFFPTCAEKDRLNGKVVVNPGGLSQY